ncbi:MAG: HNH endonuclease [Methylobacter sp.]|nr:HNH endonuclease [Methylobacter sp.]
MAIKKKEAKYWHVAEAVEALHTATVTEVKDWILEYYPAESITDVRENLYHLTVNSPSRVHYNRARTNWRSTSGHPHDRLFQIIGPNGKTAYQIYEPVRHGHVDLKQGSDEKWFVVSFDAGKLAQEEAQAQVEAFSHLPALDNDHDARVFSFQAVAARRGQATFRARLLEAYDSRCAITGSNAVAVLEAAHILPYKGEHTHRIDNGLLLRSDIHTLFDLGYIWLKPEYVICIAPSFHSTDYAELEGRTLRLPDLPKHHPNPAHLSEHARLAKQRASA